MEEFVITTKVALLIGFGLVVVLVAVGASCFLAKRFYRKRRSRTSKNLIPNTGRRVTSPYVPSQEIPPFNIPATMVPLLIQQLSVEERRGSLSPDDYQDGQQMLPPPRQSFTVGQPSPKCKKAQRSDKEDSGHSKRRSKTIKIHPPSRHSSPPSSKPVYPYPKRKNAVYRKLQKKNLGKLEFSIYYDQSFHLLQILITRGIKITSPEIQSPPDTLVIASLSSDNVQIWEQKTKTIQNSHGPKFNEKLEAHGIDHTKLQNTTLYLRLLDDKTCKIIGEIQYPTGEITVNRWIYQTLPLVAVKVAEADQDSVGSNEGETSSKLGELFISVGHNPTEQKLNVGIKSARGLRPVNKEGKANPYVKLKVNFCGYKLYERTTKTLQNTTTPNFLESYVFDLHSDKLAQTSLFFKVRHHGKLRDTELGVVHLGYSADVESEYRHWEQVIQKSHDEIEQWHELKECKPASNTF